MILFFVALVSAFLDEQKFLDSDGSWHRGQRASLPLNNACFYFGKQGCHVGSVEIQTKIADPTGAFLVEAKERDALIAIYNALDGPNWVTNFAWTTGWPCLDGWFGVYCNEDGHVISLDLNDNRLVGVMPDALNELESLRRISLSSSPSVHRYINHSRNRIQGKWPNLSKMHDLREVELSGNELTELPFIHLNKASLELLACSDNKLHTLPQVLWGMMRLEMLDLSRNVITSEIPDLFGQSMFTLRYFFIADNMLTGQIPGGIRAMTHMRVFDISNNVGIVKYWPEGIVWKEVEYLAIWGTSLTSEAQELGVTPSSVPNLCLDVPFCYKFMWDTHGDFAAATYKDFTSNTLVQETLELARKGAVEAEE